jgi:glucosamine--fructose-6-phosphate aminotransferase (isomerizing)
MGTGRHGQERAGADKVTAHNKRGGALGGFIMEECRNVKRHVYSEVLLPMVARTGGWGQFKSTPRPGSWFDALARDVDTLNAKAAAGGLTGPVEQQLAAARRIVIVACGTSYYAGLVGKLYIERFAEVPVEVVYASEFKYDKALVREGDVVIGISQSGETADTIGAVALGKERGALCLGVTNRTNTSLPRLTHAGVFLQAGPEHAVASTKAYTAQVVILGLIAARIAHARGKDSTELQAFVQSLANVPALLEQALACEEQVKRIVEEYRNIHRALFIGRRYGVPLAYEGALKLREIAYIDALGTPAGELKHGTLALVEDGVPVFAICRADELQSKMLSSMQEVSARGGHIIAITTKGDTRPTSVARHVIELPDAPEELTPIICAPVMQLLAYYFGVILGHDVDHPRNLAKSVTVE